MKCDYMKDNYEEKMEFKNELLEDEDVLEKYYIDYLEEVNRSDEIPRPLEEFTELMDAYEFGRAVYYGNITYWGGSVILDAYGNFESRSDDEFYTCALSEIDDIVNYFIPAIPDGR